MCDMKKGTKLTSTTKDFMMRVRLDKSSLEKLDFVCKQESKSRSEVVRKGIEIQYQK